MKKSKFIFLIVGIIILLVLFRTFQKETIEYIKKLGLEFWIWQFWLIVMIFFFNHIFLTYGWRVLINKPMKKPYFLKLVLARIAGDSTSAINSLGAVAGEPLKALFIKELLPFKSGLASVVLDRTIHTIANLLLILTGIIISLFILNIPVYVTLLTLLLFLVILFLMCAVLVKQRDGFVEFFINKIPGGLRNRFLNESRINKIRTLDEEIGFIFSSRENLRHFYVSLTVHYVSVLISGFLEIFLIIKFIGIDISVSHGLFVYIFGLFLTSAIFFMPANLGTSEGSYSLALKLLGYDPALGLSVGIIRRLRSFVWSAIGMCILLYAGLLKKEVDYEQREDI
ncbi:MAG TPA: lysylphosphatidylglycerol synthase transmembrane domain-containing protein [Spirochaetota bacterium]|nr:lysylphosphatidylglycerol synthase transmembrane domain-containing protein [Spirochaetota bacterium]HPJ37540.1 lysylphosphatidylglycerol synthase transmembrane domain-containing protein [Spirochaetota bacterium]HPQ53517.1 lysylphosphatidylglycerol synthase transmembrane domain-containing protein [Spirochaetota bacterium]